MKIEMKDPHSHCFHAANLSCSCMSGLKFASPFIDGIDVPKSNFSDKS